MKRKVLLQELLGAAPAAPEPTQPSPSPERRVASGAVRAMGLDLDRLASDARRAQELERQAQSGEVIVELEPMQVDPSFAEDRLARTADADFRRLVESIRSHGQQVPILVRPHPDHPDRYQVAYGHRRLAAASEIGVRVRAVIRPLSDADLVIAQGKENAERRNLTFIERALFAADLESRGFDRTTLNTALSAHPTEMARYLAVARAVPRWLAQAIGAAPRAGRPRWMELSDLLTNPGAMELATALVRQEDFVSAPSDRRFEMAIAALRKPDPRSRAGEQRTFLGADGRVVLRLEPLTGTTRLTVIDTVLPGLSAFLADRLPSLIREFEGERSPASEQQAR